MSEERVEAVGAWAIGAGIGLIALMLVWLVGNRVAGLIWAPPVGPTVAFVGAILTGIVTSIVSGIRLARRVREERQTG